MSIRREDIYRAMSDIDEKYISEAAFLTASEKKKAKFGRRTVLLCAVLAVLVCALAAFAVILTRKGDGVVLDSEKFADYRMDGATLVEYVGEPTSRLEIPDGIRVIADYAFKNNKKSSEIKVIQLSATVETVEKNAFAGCDSLEDVILAAGNENFKIENETTFSADGEYLLRYDGNAESYIVPAGVKYIAAHAFQTTNIKEVVFNDDLLYIGYNAFAGLELSEINLPDSVLELADGAFAMCVYALDGHIGANTVYNTETTFEDVPFYNTLRAGKPCPAEDILRGNVTITEAFLKSNREYADEQISAVLRYYNGLEIGTTPAYGAIYEAPSIPNGTAVPMPGEVDIEALEIIENGWSSSVACEVVIKCGGSYSLRIGFNIYDMWPELYWEDVRWRVEDITFVPDNAELTSDEKYGDWFIEYGDDGRITFTRGSYVYCEDKFPSEEYRLSLSPSGDMFILEYCSAGIWSFAVEDFTGKMHETWWSFELPCVPFYMRADGDYIPHSARWNTDEATKDEWQVICESVYGTMYMNINVDSDNFIRMSKETGDEVYIYYDVKYFDGAETRYDVLPDGAGQTKTDEVKINRVRTYYEDQTTENMNPDGLSVTIEVPSSWEYGVDTERIAASKNNVRRYVTGDVLYVFDGELTEENLKNRLGFAEEKYRDFALGKAGGNEYAYFLTTFVSGDDVTDMLTVCVRTESGYIKSMTLYSYRDGDSQNYIENVLIPVIASVTVK